MNQTEVAILVMWVIFGSWLSFLQWQCRNLADAVKKLLEIELKRHERGNAP